MVELGLGGDELLDTGKRALGGYRRRNLVQAGQGFGQRLGLDQPAASAGQVLPSGRTVTRARFTDSSSREAEVSVDGTVCQKGSYVYEPAGNVDTWSTTGDQELDQPVLRERICRVL